MANKSGVGPNTKINYQDEFTSGFVRLYIFFEWVLTKLGYAKDEFPIMTRPSASNIALRPREFGGVLSDEPTRKVSFGMTITPWDEVLSRLSPMQTDARLLANNSQHCWMLHVASVCTPCCMFLGDVGQSLKPVKLLAMCKRTQQLPTLLDVTCWEMLGKV